MKSLKNILLILSLVSISTGMFAQDIRSNTKGFSLNLNAAIGSWNSESEFLGNLDELEPTGLGVSLRAAYGFNQNIELFAALTSVGYSRELEWNTYLLTNFDFGGRYNFGATLRRFRPFLEAGVSVYGMTIDPITFDGFELFELQSSGLGGHVGGGVHFFLVPNLSITTDVKFAFGNFSNTSLSGNPVNNLDEKLDFTISTVHIGLTYFFN